MARSSTFSVSRRGFLQRSARVTASAALMSTLGGWQRALAASDTRGYRALVCVFLHGGNDSFNWLVPSDSNSYAGYASARGTLALPRESLLPLVGGTGGPEYGLHPACAGVQSLFQSGRAAFVANVGMLTRPVSAAQVRAGTAELPRHLYSHADQQVQWMTSRPDAAVGQGWAGRIADLLQSQAYNPQLSVNISLNGSNVWQQGGQTVPYALGLDGAPLLLPVTDRSYRSGARSDLLQALQQQALASAHPFERQLATTQKRSTDLGALVNGALAGAAPLQTVFPGSALGRQLHMAARMIQARTNVGAARQMFFVGMGGWDTHDEQFTRQAALLGDLSDSLKAFQEAMDELGEAGNVTAFTASDFGRTLTSNGDGSDHGWGGHALVLGGAVQGGRLYGQMPDLQIGGLDDAGGGRIVPTLACDQYAATLGRWFGISPGDLDLVFPLLNRFAQSDLGFMI